jgi:DNA modification methylase
MRSLPESSIDAIVTDPPYGIEFMGRDFDKLGQGPQMQEWHRAWAVEALRVAKPGAFLLAFGGTRTWHRLACAIEDAGWEIRDTLMWMYGQGFSKSMDVSKAIDKAAGSDREKIPEGNSVKRMVPGADQYKTNSWIKSDDHMYQSGREVPVTEAARTWEGYGTSLKPAWEPVVVARKPLAGTVVDNVLKHGTGALNIDGTRIRIAPTSQDGSRSSPDDSICDTCPSREVSHTVRSEDIHMEASSAPQRDGRSVLRPSESEYEIENQSRIDSRASRRPSYRLDDGLAHAEEEPDQAYVQQRLGDTESPVRQLSSRCIHAGLSTCLHRTTPHVESQGRFPANVIHDGSEEVVGMFPDRKTTWIDPSHANNRGGDFLGALGHPGMQGFNDSGSAARFFYTSKADASERWFYCRICQGAYPASAEQGHHHGKGLGKCQHIFRHPTVKPLSLCSWLCRLVSMPGGSVILDPFMGSGSTGVAALVEGQRFVGVEMDGEFFALSAARVADAKRQPGLFD